MGEPALFKLNDKVIGFNLSGDIDFKLNDRPINFRLNAVTEEDGSFRLLEDGERLLLEDGFFRLLE